MEIENDFDESEIISNEEQEFKIREKLKNKKKNYTIKEIKIVLNYYNKIGNIRGISTFFDIPKSTGWVNIKDEHMTAIVKSNKCRLKSGGRKTDSAEYDEILNEFIKEGRSHDIAITSSEVIAKALEIIPEFKNKSYDALIHWFNRFQIRYSHSFPKILFRKFKI